MLADAVRVLTEAARLTRPVYETAAPEQAADLVSEAWAATVGPDGAELSRDVQEVRRYVDTGRREPADFAEFVAQALVAAAANVGGVGPVLAGRSGSWEADAVRQLVVGTVGEDEEYLLAHRTAPVVVRVFVDEVLHDLGVWARYDDAMRALSDRASTVDVDAPEQDDIAAEEDRLEQERQRVWAEYGDALRAHIETAAAARPALTVPVEVVVDLVTFRQPEDMTGGQWFGIEEQLLQEAIAAVPAPTGPTPG